MSLPAEPLRDDVPTPGRSTARMLEPPPARSTDGLLSDLRRPVIAGLMVLFMIFAVGGVWVAIAPLAGAAIAPGVVSPEGSRQTVQHLEGGIIREILVRDSDVVIEGQRWSCSKGSAPAPRWASSRSGCAPSRRSRRGCAPSVVTPRRSGSTTRSWPTPGRRRWSPFGRHKSTLSRPGAPPR